MKHTGIKIPGYRFDRDGRLVPSKKHLDVSTKLKRASSKKVRVVKRKPG